MIKYTGQLRGSHELFQIYALLHFFFFHFTIDVLNLKLCFATDVLRGRVRYPSLAPFCSHADLNLLMKFLYFTGKKRPVPRIRD